MEAFKYGMDIPYIQQLLKESHFCNQKIKQRNARVQVRRTRRVRRSRQRQVQQVRQVIQKKVPSKNIVLPISTFLLNLNNRYNILGSSN
jgi:hypothetical protein